jgi:hypothetical protein|tara:strand:- start:777 stop:881 length:105 start_codon:yes stop_codon:yes gene_type:complete
MAGGCFFEQIIQVLRLKARSEVLLVYVHVGSVIG